MDHAQAKKRDNVGERDNTEWGTKETAAKRALHEHHIKRKRCRLLRRQDIINAFWNVYEQEAFNRLNELINDLSVANEPDRYVFDAIMSVDKNEIIKLWREKCMFLFPQVEQHQMVPFHDRWIQSQFKEEKNYTLREMTRRGKGRKKEVLVHWKGWPKSYDSWLPASQLISLQQP